METPHIILQHHSRLDRTATLWMLGMIPIRILEIMMMWIIPMATVRVAAVVLTVAVIISLRIQVTIVCSV